MMARQVRGICVMRFMLRHRSMAALTIFGCVLATLPAMADDHQVAAAMPAGDAAPYAPARAVTAAAPPVTMLNAAVPTQTARPKQSTQIERTRFVIGLSRKIDADVFALSDPNRVVVELPDIPLSLPDPERAAEIGLITSFRMGLAGPRRARLVINVSRAVVVDKPRVEKTADGGYRLVLEFSPFYGARGQNAAQRVSTNDGSASPTPNGRVAMPPVPRRAASPKERLARAFKPVIVLDPGHGGHDTGAMKFGTVEKQVVLAFGHELRRQLEASGRYRVLMTREDDTFVPLDKRVAFGERHDASLFIAIHADYASSSARGATIYTLRSGMARSLKSSAKGSLNRKVLTMAELEDVDSRSVDGRVVRDILSDLAARDVEANLDRTGMFAEAVIETMGESTPMRQDPDKQAGFRVLKTAQFPSVLIELAYVSNRQDARNLQSDEWRKKVANSITDAIENYFSTQVARLPM